jgi:leucine dehydrogenase
MDNFSVMSKLGYGDLYLRRDASVNLSAMIAIHDTRMGPALGGCRMIAYPTEEAAVLDALRLARGMTYKAALAGLPHGGGKSVILRPPGDFDRRALFRAFGRFVDSLAGRYITAEDSGTSVDDMEAVRQTTKHVTGVRVENGGSGDPSPFTARGVRRGIEACAKLRLGRGDIEGLKVLIQGVGHVGHHLARELVGAGAKVIVADVDASKAKRVSEELGVGIADTDEVFGLEADVLAPCALGSGMNDATVPWLKVPIVAGAANNQLAEPRHGDLLHARGILYAPDYAINAGGLINVASEVRGYDRSWAVERVDAIYDTIAEIAERSKAVDVPTYRVADQMVEERLATAAERVAV